MKKYLPMAVAFVLVLNAKAQNVGVGTTTPAARLHVSDSNVLFTGPESAPFITNFSPPAQGRGVRLMWYAHRGAFRAGYDDSTRWNKDSIGRLSVAMGESNVASGFASTALGSYNRATNTSTTTLGEFNQATNYGATAIGTDNIASGSASLAAGQLTLAIGNNSSTFGLSTKASGFASTALGYNTIASGDSSVAMGASTKAQGTISTAMGKNTLAYGAYSTSMGLNTSAWGFASTTMGQSTNAIGEGSLATGSYSTASGAYSIAMGDNAVASSYSAVALGSFTSATNYASTALGASTSATGFGSTAIGYESTASGNLSAAFGYGLKAKANNSFVVGNFNDTTGINRVFEVGCGSSNNSRRTAFTVTNQGYVGIGKLLPLRPLEISSGNSGATYHQEAHVGIESIGSHYINMLSSNSGEMGLLFGNVLSGSDGGVIYRAATATLDPQALYFRAGSSTRFAVYKTGSAWLQGTLTQASDARLKKDIVPLSGTLASIDKLNGYTYYWKDEQRDKEQQIGFIAQEVQQLYPQLVKESADGHLSINYMGLVPVLLEGLKELKTEVEQLKTRIIQYEKSIN